MPDIELAEKAIEAEICWVLTLWWRATLSNLTTTALDMRRVVSLACVRRSRCFAG
jgi:hypothetical protein